MNIIKGRVRICEGMY